MENLPLKYRISAQLSRLSVNPPASPGLPCGAHPASPLPPGPTPPSLNPANLHTTYLTAPGSGMGARGTRVHAHGGMVGQPATTEQHAMRSAQQCTHTPHTPPPPPCAPAHAPPPPVVSGAAVWCNARSVVLSRCSLSYACVPVPTVQTPDQNTPHYGSLSDDYRQAGTQVGLAQVSEDWQTCGERHITHAHLSTAHMRNTRLRLRCPRSTAPLHTLTRCAVPCPCLSSCVDADQHQYNHQGNAGIFRVK